MSEQKRKPLKRSTRGQTALVVKTLGKRIAAGEIKPGETLPVEQELARSLNVGRNSLREAIKILSAKGMISSAPRSGTKVRSPEDWNMLDPDLLEWHADPNIASPQFMLSLTEMRRMLEPEASRLAARRATREDVAKILAAYERMEQFKEGEVDVQADIDFHTSILTATHNPFLANFRHCVVTFLNAHFRYASTDVMATASNLALHRKIAWAIAAGKEDEAFDATAELLEINREKIETELASLQPDQSS
ncbi:MAG: FadR/GntR family transcriptional regulator [Pseudomonadota bacterium]